MRVKRFVSEYKLPDYDALVLTAERPLAEYFEKVASISGNPKAASNWVMTELLRELNESKKEVIQSPISAENLGKMIAEIEKGTLSGKMAKQVFSEMWSSGKDPLTIIKEKGLVQITDNSAIEKLIDDIIAANPGQVEQYRLGKDKLFGYFVGQVMKVSKGQASPDMVNDLLKSKLKSLS